ncbi:MAG TPA: glycosyltransferase family 2 protein [Acidobacteriota bacterium]|jgi:GT2 family glycosyltransferase
MDASIVIPTWNGAALLRKFLPSVIDEAQRYMEDGEGDLEILVVDDASRDNTVEILRGLPVQVVQRRQQGGFPTACNSGIAASRFPYLILLNNDVWIARGFVTAMLEPFRDPEVFAVTARVFEPDTGLLATSGKVGRFRRGFWSVYFNYDVRHPEDGAAPDLLSAYAVGGFCALRSQPAKEWGGFDEMFAPFHWEDIDLSYRAWKRGWKVVYQPRAVAWHRASSTINREFCSRKVEVVAVRNRLLFHWKNIHNGAFVCRHLAMLLALLASRWMVADWSFYTAFRAALRKWPQLKAHRAAEKSAAVRSDRSVRDILHNFSLGRAVDLYRNEREVKESHHERRRNPDYSQ